MADICQPQDIIETNNTLGFHPQEDYNNRELIQIPSDILFPSELNQHLKQEIHYLMQENCHLKKNVKELEDTVEKYQKQEIDTSKSVTTPMENDYLPVSEVTRSKIVELSKKLREKSSEIIHYKNKCAKLDQIISMMKLQESEKLANSQIEEKQLPKPSESELKILNDKIASLNSKLFEEKNQNLCLKNDIKLATKILQEEIGEGFESIQQFSNNGHWRGRAQIINDLQHKFNELKEKLKVYQDKEGNKSCEIASKKMYLEKKIDKLTRDNDILRADIDNLTRKLETSKQKSKSLDAESTGWKMKYSNILDQFEKEHNLISTMTEQNTNSKIQLNESLKRKDKQLEKLQKENKELKLYQKRIECDVENLRKLLAEKEVEIENVKKTPSKFDMSIQNLNPSQLSAERLRLVELTKVLSDRVQKERDRKAHFEGLYRVERQKAAKLESHLARARLDSDNERSSYASLLLNRSTLEKNCEFKLELSQEKIKALQTRLEIEKNERELDLQEFTKIMQNYQ